jgi:hypothetical protein
VTARRTMIGAIPVDLERSKPITEREYAIAEPGEVRSVAFMPRERLVMARGEPAFEEVLTLFVESDLGKPQRRRRFVIVPTAAAINVPDGRALVFIGTATSPTTSAAAHVFELKTVE